MALYFEVGGNIVHPAANTVVQCQLDSKGTLQWQGCSFADGGLQCDPQSCILRLLGLHQSSGAIYRTAL
jgi:hypothetical protein